MSILNLSCPTRSTLSVNRTDSTSRQLPSASALSQSIHLSWRRWAVKGLGSDGQVSFATFAQKEEMEEGLSHSYTQHPFHEYRLSLTVDHWTPS
jgi:hypothetical protein